MRPSNEAAIDYLKVELPKRLQAAGYDAKAVANNPLLVACAMQVVRGHWTIDRFLDNVEKVAIMNPAIRAPKTTIETVTRVRAKS